MLENAGLVFARGWPCPGRQEVSEARDRSLDARWGQMPDGIRALGDVRQEPRELGVRGQGLTHGPHSKRSAERVGGAPLQQECSAELLQQVGNAAGQGPRQS